jgi:hypothetical protein
VKNIATMTLAQSKKCKNCLSVKPTEKFEKTSKGYRLNTCSACRSKIKKINNPEKAKIYQQKSDKKRINNQKRKQQIAQYKKNNPDIARKSAHKRRVFKYGNGHAPYSTKDIVSVYGTKCYLCNTEINFDVPRNAGHPGWETSFWVEHVIDIAKGGEDNLKNVRPSHGWCNLHKKDFLSKEITKNPFIVVK